MNQKAVSFCIFRAKGFSLIEVLVALGILSIASLVIATMFTNSQKSMENLSEKFQIQNLNNTLLYVLKSQPVCVSNFTNGVGAIDLSGATTTVASTNTINLNELHYGVTTATPVVAKVGQSLPGAAPGRMVVQSIQLKNILWTGTPKDYKGTLVVSFDPTSISSALKPAAVDQVFNIGVSPATAAVISSCDLTVPVPTTSTTGNCGPIGVEPGLSCGLGPLAYAFCNYAGDPPVTGLPACTVGASHVVPGFPTQVAGNGCYGDLICWNGTWVTPAAGGGGGDGGDGGDGSN